MNAKVYQIFDKSTGEKIIQITSHSCRRAKWKFYALDGFGHYGDVVCREIKEETKTHKGATMFPCSIYSFDDETESLTASAELTRLSELNRELVEVLANLMGCYRPGLVKPDEREKWDAARAVLAKAKGRQ